MSGIIPDSENGIDSAGQRNELMPFCPCLDANLSPIIGLR